MCVGARTAVSAAASAAPAAAPARPLRAPRLPRAVVSTPRVDLNRLWGQLEAMVPCHVSWGATRQSDDARLWGGASQKDLLGPSDGEGDDDNATNENRLNEQRERAQRERAGRRGWGKGEQGIFC